jgi:hypothetical protein
LNIMVATVFAILGSAASAGVTLLMLVLIAACAPNSSPEQTAQLNRLAVVVMVSGGVGLAGSTACLIMRRPPWAVVLGWSPVAVAVGVMFLLFQVG